ncbi:MAG: hypothetical protein GY940_32505 [bacterium]|nr:hypothetical protein [bacterium]
MPKNHETRFLVWISMPRAGSNYVSDLLAHVDNCWSFREIFQPGGVHLYNGVRGYPEPVLEACRERFGVPLPSDPAWPPWRSIALIKKVRRYPGEFLDLLADQKMTGYIAFKVFSRHLTHGRLGSEVLARPDVYPVIYHRDVIEAFVSVKKAEQAGISIGADTTGIEVELDWPHFLRFVHNTVGFIDRTCGFINGENRDNRNIPCLSYEELMEPPDDLTRLRTVTGCLNEGWNLDLRAIEDGGGVKTRVHRQDRARDFNGTVVNWNPFLEECRSHGLDGRHSVHLREEDETAPKPGQRLKALTQWCRRPQARLSLLTRLRMYRSRR